jgi:hypothetical protein
MAKSVPLSGESPILVTMRMILDVDMTSRRSPEIADLLRGLADGIERGSIALTEPGQTPVWIGPGGSVGTLTVT